MKLEDLDKFIYEQDLLRDVEEKAGIYAITIDKRVVYVGQSKNIYQRCRSHIYNIFNAMYNKEKKYQLLLSAWLGGHRIDCFQLDYCDIDQLKEKANEWIKIYKPKLNILTPTGKNDISELRIEQLLNFGKNKGNIGKGIRDLNYLLNAEQDSND